MNCFLTLRACTLLTLTSLPLAVFAQEAPKPETQDTTPPVAQSPAKETVPPATQPQTLAPKTPKQTPAQEKYGAPRNPIVGGPVDLDVSKPLSLDRAIHIGLQRQNSIAISQQQVEAANARLTQARSSYYPQITPSLNYNTNLQPGGVTIISGQTFRSSSSSESRSDAIVAQQLLFDTGLREANVGSARRNAIGSAYGLGDERQAVILLVTQAYYNLARFKALVKVQEENVVRAQKNLEIINEQAKVGLAAKSDPLQFQSDLENAKVALLSAQSDYAVGQANLKNAMGVVTSQQLVLTDDNVPAPDPAMDKLTVDDYVKSAYANRLDVKQQQENVNAQGYIVRSAFINAGLTVSASIQQGYALDPNAGEERFFSLSVSYPLFDGGSTRAVVREAKANLESARRGLDQLQQTVRLNVEQSWQIREVARQRVAAAQVAVNAGKTNLDAATAKLENGLINVLDVLNAQVQYVTAQVNLVQAIYDFYNADAQLTRYIGLNDLEYSPRIPGAKPTRFLPRPGTPPAPQVPQVPQVKNTPDSTLPPAVGNSQPAVVSAGVTERKP